MPPELAIILPACYDQASVRKVVLEWFQEVENWMEDFCILFSNEAHRPLLQNLARNHRFVA